MVWCMTLERKNINLRKFIYLLHALDQLDQGSNTLTNGRDIVLYNKYVPLNEIILKQPIPIDNDLLDSYFNSEYKNILFTFAKCCNLTSQVLNENALETVTYSPRTYLCYMPRNENNNYTVENIVQVAFHHMMKIINLHPFSDGNKRTACIAAMDLIQNLTNMDIILYSDHQIDLALSIYKHLDSNRMIPNIDSLEEKFIRFLSVSLLSNTR